MNTITQTILAIALIPLTSFALEWKELPPIPNAKGFAGGFAGVSGGALVVAGGTNFPDKLPWEGGTKVWYDDVFVLEKPDGAWRKVGKLPKPNGYGVSITTERGVIIIGGGNASEHFSNVVRLEWKNGALKTEPLPELPKPCAFMAGALAGNVIHVVGGIVRPDATSALQSHWSLDLAKPDAAWKVEPPLLGAGRILATAGARDGSLYLFSGAALKRGKDGNAEREWLKDAYHYAQKGGWKRLANLPRVAVAAPGPAPQGAAGELLVMGGDDGSHMNFQPKDKHPGFPREVLAYDAAKDVWSRVGEVPFSLVTSNAVIWNKRIVIPGGEARPGVRSPAVWSAEAR